MQQNPKNGEGDIGDLNTRESQENNPFSYSQWKKERKT